MLGMVILEYLLHFYRRGRNRQDPPTAHALDSTAPGRGSGGRGKVSPLLGGVVALQLLVMLSRVVLGMHAFDQVLTGCALGLFTILIYYCCVEGPLVAYVCFLTRTPNRKYHSFAVLMVTALCMTLSIVLFAAIPHEDDPYWQTIQHTDGCGKAKLHKSFQYKCLQDSSLLMVASGLLVGLIWTPRPDHLLRPLAYSHRSLTWARKILLMIVAAGVPVLTFMLPLFFDLSLAPLARAIGAWLLQGCAFFLGTFSLLTLAPRLTQRCGLERYGPCGYRHSFDRPLHET